MPQLLYKYCKLKEIRKMAQILKQDLITIKEDSLLIQNSIWTMEAQYRLEKKTFKFPNLDINEGLKTKCNQFLSLLESLEEEIQILKAEKLTVGPGVSDTEFLSENLVFWPNLVQMVSISLKVTTIQIEPQMVPLGATRGRSFFYYMKIEGSKPAIYE